MGALCASGSPGQVADEANLGSKKGSNASEKPKERKRVGMDSKKQYANKK